MKVEILLLVTGSIGFATGLARAQVVPTTPTKFTTRPVGGATASTGATVNNSSSATPARSVRQVTYLTLSPLRQWNSTDGKSLMGKMIAWEETVTTTQGTSAPAPQTAPITTKPTLLRENKVRLLVETKAYEVPLDRLAEAERKFILELQRALSAKP